MVFPLQPVCRIVQCPTSVVHWYSQAVISLEAVKVSAHTDISDSEDDTNFDLLKPGGIATGNTSDISG